YLRYADGAEEAVIEAGSVGGIELKGTARSGGAGEDRAPAIEIGCALHRIDLTRLGGDGDLIFAICRRRDGEMSRRRAENGGQYLGRVVSRIEIGLRRSRSNVVLEHTRGRRSDTQSGGEAGTRSQGACVEGDTTAGQREGARGRVARNERDPGR